jgi:hypothetical protein
MFWEQKNYNSKKNSNLQRKNFTFEFTYFEKIYQKKNFKYPGRKQEYGQANLRRLKASSVDFLQIFILHKSMTYFKPLVTTSVY